MMAQKQAVVPANIQEFNEIAGVIFSRLYQAFPVAQDLDRDWIAQSLKRKRSDELASGRTFDEVMVHTGYWLLVEGFILTGGLGDPWHGTVLSAKALHAMNLPGAIGTTLGTEIAQAAEHGHQAKLAELTGNFLGNFVGGVIKSWTG